MKNQIQNKLAFLLIVVPTTVVSLGCAMCCGPTDYDYPGYGGGGRVQRADPVYGRVGSIFSDPNLAGMGPLADSNVLDPEMEPLKTPDSLDPPKTSPQELPGNGILPAPDAGQPDNPIPQPQQVPIQPTEDVTDRQTRNRWRPSQPPGSFR